MTATATATGAEIDPRITAAAAKPPPESSNRNLLPYLVTPVLVAVALLVLYRWVSSQTLDTIEQRSLNQAYLTSRTVKHVELTAIVVALILLIAVPLGVLLTRPGAKRLATPVLTLANIGQAIPSFGLVILLAVTLVQVGVNSIAIIAFTLYGILPILRNTMVGLQQVDRSVIEAARGVGMGRAKVLWQIELPLALPVILAGVRTALIITVGTVALATFVGAGGLGDVISNGIASNRQTVLIVGSVLVACLALVVDWLSGIVENVLKPRGL